MCAQHEQNLKTTLVLTHTHLMIREPIVRYVSQMGDGIGETVTRS